MGEHLPCKQGVMSSNLTISTGSKIPSKRLYLENRILKEKYLKDRRRHPGKTKKLNLKKKFVKHKRT